MAKTDKADMSCARVKQYTASDVSKAERHNERKNETYENMNVIAERIPFNVHFKKPTAPTYMEQLKQMETDGQVSLRGLRKDATLFDEIVIDVNTMYFERNGGYEYAKLFYEEAYHFIEEKFGADNVISAVMHADEINMAASEELGKEVYHYHLHAMVLPVVEKEILWSKRCKDEKLRGTVKEVVNQISHSKKWKSDIPMTDEKGNPLLKKNGKPMFRASYSILQDELFNYMTEQGFKGFQRGEYGSTAEHLTSLQYQIQQDNLGFLTDLDPDNAQQQLADVLEGHYISEKRFLLEAQVCQQDCQKRISTAINEVVLHPGKVAHMIEFEVYIDEIFAFSQRSDGLIISTPTGSTAYSLSAGGPILTPSLDAITLVPMFPHTLSARPLVINSSSTIRLRFSHRRNDLEISCDSQIALPIQEGEDVLIRRCDYHLNLIHPKDYSYFNTLSTKLGWSKKLF